MNPAEADHIDNVIEKISNNYLDWCEAQTLPSIPMRELWGSELLSKEQRKDLKMFMMQWETWNS